MKPAGLYIHVPFCSSVCPYCDFAVTIAGRERREEYLAAVECEIRSAATHGWFFDTVYLGGGTPTELSPDQLGRILGAVRSHLHVDPSAALHLEVNPDHVNPVNARRWCELGLEFASVGVQSFDDDALAFLGRRHSAVVARSAVETLLDAGIPTVSIDLVFGLPGQSLVDWRRQLEEATTLGVQHLSCYQLTVHQGTVFGRRLERGELVELADDQQAELYLATHDVLGEAGWKGYEVSNFAMESLHRSKHNRKYWNHSPYLGLGPSAHSFDGRVRLWNRRKVRLWAAALLGGRSAVVGEERLTDEELFFEAVMLGLRTTEGIDPTTLRTRFGDEVAQLNQPSIDRLIASGHLRLDGTRLIPTPRGMAIAEGLVNALLP